MTARKLTNHLIIILAFAFLAGANVFKEVLPSYTFNGIERSWYYISWAMGIMMLSGCLYRSLPEYSTAFFVFGSSICNLTDELFFDPLVLQLNEIVWYTMLLILTIYLYGYRKADYLNKL